MTDFEAFMRTIVATDFYYNVSGTVVYHNYTDFFNRYFTTCCPQTQNLLLPMSTAVQKTGFDTYTSYTWFFTSRPLGAVKTQIYHRQVTQYWRKKEACSKCSYLIYYGKFITIDLGYINQTGL